MTRKCVTFYLTMYKIKDTINFPSDNIVRQVMLSHDHYVLHQYISFS